MDKIIADAAMAAGSVKDDSLIGTFYKDLAQPTIKAIGVALGSTVEFCTAPALLMKFGSEVAKLNYTKHITNYAKKLESIPEEDRIAIDPQIGVPILKKLCSVTNEEISNLFTSLLAKASSRQTQSMAHPAFIQIVGSLSVDEAIIVKSLAKQPLIKYARMLVKTNAWGYIEEFDKLTLLAKEHSLLFPQNVSLYMVNLSSLGVLSAPQTTSPEPSYIAEWDELLDFHGFAEWQQKHQQSYGEGNIQIEYGFYRTTYFGKAFVDACVS
jgi:hypothetical protein